MGCCASREQGAQGAAERSNMYDSRGGDAEMLSSSMGGKRLAQQISDPTNEDEILRAFKRIDADGNGFLSRKELRNYMTSLGGHWSDRDIDMLIKAADVNNDGKIDYYEYVRLIRAYKKVKKIDPSDPEEIRRAFRSLDTNGDGVLSPSELRLFSSEFVDAEEMDDQMIELIMEEADTNRDGMIDYDEFSRLLQSAHKGNRVRNPTDNLELREAFTRLDTDGNGVLSPSELKLFSKALGYDQNFDIDDETVAHLIAECDLDGDGQIDYREFERMFQAYNVARQVKDPGDTTEMRQVFDKIDTDKNGYLCASELKIFLTHITGGQEVSEDLADKLIAESDSYNDGKIDYKDFVRMMKKIQSH